MKSVSNICKLFSLLLLSLLIALVSCESVESDSVQSILSDEALDVSGFTLIRADETDGTVIDAAIRLKTALNDRCGLSLQLGTDWVNRGEEPPSDTAEILIGSTNRRQSDISRLGDYSIVREGNRIYILGGSSEAVSEAVDYFIENLISDAGVLVKDGGRLDIRKDYAISQLSFGDNAPESFAVYDETGTYAGRIAALLSERTGCPSEIVKKADAANVLVLSEDSAVASDCWGVVCEDGKLKLVCSQASGLKKAFGYFKDELSAASGTLKFADGLAAGEHQLTREEYYETEQLVIYPEFPEEINRDYLYSVSVTQNGRTESLQVYSHAMQNNVRTRSVGGDLYRRFSAFAFSGSEVRVDINVGCDFDSYSVLPSSKNYKSEFKDGVISVWLDEPDYFLIRLDDDDNSILSVFADYPEFNEELPDEDAPNFIRIDGWVEPEGGILELKEPNTVLYISPGSVLNARVVISGNGSKVIGHGAIVDPYENIYDYDITVGGSEAQGYNLLRITGDDITVDGPVLLDARCYNLMASGSNIEVRNVKILSTMMTTDGITFYRGDNLLAEHCFIYVGDNGMVFGSFDNDNIGTIYRDITVGTTCAAIFPQGSPKDTLLEDIHVFRCNEGIVNNYNNIYSPGRVERSISLTIRRLDAVDCTYVPWLFLGRNMGSLDKSIAFEDISIRTTTGNSDPAVIDDPVVLRFVNGDSYMYSENYTLEFRNLSIDGKLITDASQIIVTSSGDHENKLSFDADDSFEPVKQNQNNVAYTAPDKIFAGQRLLSFASPVIRDNELMLPVNELSEAMRLELSGGTVENSIEYISASALTKYGIEVEERDGSVYIDCDGTGRNLLLPDSGEISRFTEAVCYTLDLCVREEDGTEYYSVENIETLNSGITRFITDEVRTFGAGTYRLSFKAKASEKGSLTVAVTSELIQVLKETISVDTGWKEISVEFTITDEEISQPMTVMTIRGALTPLESFGTCDYVLEKLN